MQKKIFCTAVLSVHILKSIKAKTFQDKWN